MHCVGLKPEFHIVQSIITTYWEKGRKTEALCFVKQMLETGVDSDNEDPAAFLLLKMVRAGEQKEAIQLVRILREEGFQLRVSAYSAALLAAVKEQEQVNHLSAPVSCVHLLTYFQSPMENSYGFGCSVILHWHCICPFYSSFMCSVYLFPECAMKISNGFGYYVILHWHCICHFCLYFMSYFYLFSESAMEYSNGFGLLGYPLLALHLLLLLLFLVFF